MLQLSTDALVLKFIHLIPFPGASCDPASRTPRDPPGRGSTGTAARPWRCGARCRPSIAATRASRESKTAFLSLCRTSLEKNPSTAFHGTHPGRRGRREVKRPVGMALQPLVDLGRAVRRHVVENDVHRGSGPDPLRTPFRDVVEEGRGTPPSGAARPSGPRPSPWRRRGPPEGMWCRAAVARSRLRMVRRHRKRPPRAS